MMLLAIVAWLAPAAACDLATSLGTLAATGSKEDYLCIAGEPGGAAALAALLRPPPLPSPAAATLAPPPPTATIALTPDGSARHTRALTLWLLARVDDPWDPALVRLLSPGDRRLLSDGVYAARGRTSPAPEHHAIFENLPWYKPDPKFTNGRLHPGDLAQIALADDPPPPPVPIPEAPAERAPPPAKAAYGCAYGPFVGVAAALALVVFAAQRWRPR